MRKFVGRSGAFDAWFFPARSRTADRWRSVYGTLLEGKTLPQVELYKLGDAYFVVDGNHRVSGAHWRGMVAVDAVVAEFGRGLPAVVVFSHVHAVRGGLSFWRGGVHFL